VLILIGGFSFGLGTYQAHMASDAIQLPATHKMDMGDAPGAIDTGTLLGYVTSGKTTGTLSSGALISNISVAPVNQYTALMVGSKTFVPLASFVPGFTIKTAQVMNQGLLDAANTGGATVRPVGTPWVPGGAPVMPPWLGGP
jgi:hypothetical protein